jgi:SOS-response transcriptional repressor LexA
VRFDRAFVASDDTFLLRVRGRPWRGAACTTGDYVMVTPTVHARTTGDLVAVRVAAEVLVRAFERRVDGVLLRAADPAVPDVAVRPTDDHALLGTVSGCSARWWTVTRCSRGAVSA